METGAATGINPSLVGTDVWETILATVTCAMAIFDRKLAGTGGTGTGVLTLVSHVL